MSSEPFNRNSVSRFGLTELYSTSNPLVDIVFAHGLNGRPYNAWTCKRSPWPVTLLPKDLDDLAYRVLGYGYDGDVGEFGDGTSQDHIHHHAEHLASRLVANRSVSTYRPQNPPMLVYSTC